VRWPLVPVAADPVGGPPDRPGGFRYDPVSLSSPGGGPDRALRAGEGADLKQRAGFGRG